MKTNALFLSCLLAAVAAQAKPALIGDTNHERESVFFPDEKVELNFTVTGLEPKKPGPDLKVRIVDEYEKELWKKDFRLLADWNGNEAVHVTGVPCGRLGFYRVYAELADGTLLTSPWASRRNGEMTYAVVRRPKDRELVDEEILMIYGNFDERVGGRLPPAHGQDFLGNGKANPRWAGRQTSGCWCDLEANRPGEYVEDPDRDNIRLGRHVMLLSGAPNRWSDADKKRIFRMENHKWDGRPPALTPEGEKAFERFLRAWVPNYRRQFIDRKPRVYEVSSEWEKSENGSRTTADIVRCYEIASKVIHELDPEGIVCGVGYGPTEDHTMDFLRHGLGKYIDALTVHPYYNPDPVEPNGIIQTVKAARETIFKATGKYLPIINTECGYATYDQKPAEAVQMKHLVRLQSIYAGEGWKSLSLFCRIDYRLQPGFGYIYNLSYGRSHTEYGMDYPGPKTSPKPLYPAMSALCWFLANSRPCGDIPFLGRTCWGYVFKHVPDGKVNLSLWDWGRTRDEAQKIDLRVGRAEVEVADHMGNVRTVKANAKGEIPLELYDMPVYVLDVDPAIWEHAGGERDKLAAEFKAREEAARRAKGIEIGELKPCLAADGGAGLEVALTDTTGKPNDGTLELVFKDRPDDRLSVAYSLKPGETAAVVVPLGKLAVYPFRHLEFAATAKLRDGRTVAKEDKANFFVVPKAPALAIDGDFSKWERMPLVTIEDCVEKPQYYKGPEDQQAKAWIGWDEKGLVFYFDVDDDKYQMRPGRTQYCWGADAVQIALAKAYRYEKTSNTLLDLISEGKALYSFALVPEPYAHRHASWDAENPVVNHPKAPVDLNDGKSGYEMQGKVTNLPNGRVREQWEIRIPWHAINFANPKPGDRIAFGFILNDHDEKDFGRYTGLGAFHLHFSERFGAMLLGR